MTLMSNTARTGGQALEEPVGVVGRLCVTARQLPERRGTTAPRIKPRKAEI